FDTESRGTEASIKLNHQLGAKDSLILRYAYSKGRVIGDVQGADNVEDRSVLGRSLTTDHSLVGNWLSVISPTRVNEFRIQIGQRTQDFRPNSMGPMFEIRGVVKFGQSYRLNADRRATHLEAV